MSNPKYCPECGNLTLLMTDWTDGSSSETPYCYCTICGAEFFMALIDSENSYYGELRKENEKA